MGGGEKDEMGEILWVDIHGKKKRQNERETQEEAEVAEVERERGGGACREREGIARKSHTVLEMERRRKSQRELIKMYRFSLSSL